MLWMRVPLPNVVQLAPEAQPSAHRESSVEKREPVKRGSRPLIFELRRRGEGDLDMSTPPQSHENSTGFSMMACCLAILIDAPQYRRVHDNEPIIRWIAEH